MYISDLRVIAIYRVLCDLSKFDVQIFATNVTYNGNKNIEIGLRAAVSPTHFR